MVDLHGISQEAFDLGIESEVSSREVYERRYRGPTHPGEQSGVTCGIGYDFGQATPAQVKADWSGKIPPAMVRALAKTCGVTGPAAKPLAEKLRDVVDIPWDAALEVYSNHDLPRYTGMCRDHLPGYDELHPHCKGALFSLVLNRGPSFDARGPRYAEMRAIKEAIKAGELDKVPALLRSMQRLWPNSKGLRIRRDKEAALWETGIGAPSTHDVPHPDVVAHVQTMLRNLGYFQVGAADGTLGRKTRGAILAFRHDHGLPLTPTIDDDLLTALTKAQPPEQDDTRATATVNDVREEGSHTIEITDMAKKWAGRLFGSGLAGLGAAVSAQVDEVKTAMAALAGLGISPEIIVGAVALAGAGLFVWFIAHKIEQRRLYDYQTGKHP